nr:hypothetical protein CFP56_75677 [Quercus suber]
MMATLSDLNLHVPSAIWEFPHHHRQLFNKHGVRGGVKIPLAQGDAHAEEEGIESNSVAWVNAHLKALGTLCKQKASNPEKADTFVMRWVDQLFSISFTHFRNGAECFANSCLQRDMNPFQWLLESKNSLLLMDNKNEIDDM